MEEIKYKIYEVRSSACYSGTSLVAAENAKEANKFIQQFKDRDLDNSCDSWGYDFIEEYDAIEDLFAERKGFITYGIRYSG
jgi:hypothetical protein